MKEICENLKDLDGELWKEIEGYNGDYQVSNLGRVKSFKKCRGIDVRILIQNKDKDGYLFVGLYKNGKPKTKLIHILMYESFIEEIPEKYIVHHTDFTKNNFLDNFEIMTNEEHLRLHNEGKNHPMYGKDFSGENGPNHTLTEKDVIQIKKYLSEGILTQKEIGEKFNVSPMTISNIKLRKSWKYVTFQI